MEFANLCSCTCTPQAQPQRATCQSFARKSHGLWCKWLTSRKASKPHCQNIKDLHTGRPLMAQGHAINGALVHHSMYMGGCQGSTGTPSKCIWEDHQGSTGMPSKAHWHATKCTHAQKPQAIGELAGRQHKGCSDLQGSQTLVVTHLGATRASV